MPDGQQMLQHKGMCWKNTQFVLLSFIVVYISQDKFIYFHLSDWVFYLSNLVGEIFNQLNEFKPPIVLDNDLHVSWFSFLKKVFAFGGKLSDSLLSQI